LTSKTKLPPGLSAFVICTNEAKNQAGWKNAVDAVDCAHGSILGLGQFETGSILQKEVSALRDVEACHFQHAKRIIHTCDREMAIDQFAG